LTLSNTHYIWKSHRSQTEYFLSTQLDSIIYCIDSFT